MLGWNNRKGIGVLASIIACSEDLSFPAPLNKPCSNTLYNCVVASSLHVELSRYQDFSLIRLCHSFTHSLTRIGYVNWLAYFIHASRIALFHALSSTTRFKTS